jgi:integral membrane protein (TIGR01906 family)
MAKAMTKMRVKAGIEGRAMAWLFRVCTLMIVLGAAATPGSFQHIWKKILPEWPAAQFSLPPLDFELQQLANALARALHGEPEALNLRVTVGGELRSFNAREIAHMADVAALFRAARVVLWASGLALLALGVWVWRGCRRKCNWAGVAKGALVGALDIVALAVLLTIWAMIDFRAVFWAFHRVAFANDLWLLDPRTDLLIQLMPQPFFEYAAREIALWWAGCAALWFCGAWTLLCQARKNVRGKNERIF